MDSYARADHYQQMPGDVVHLFTGIAPKSDPSLVGHMLWILDQRDKLRLGRSTRTVVSDRVSFYPPCWKADRRQQNAVECIRSLEISDAKVYVIK